MPGRPVSRGWLFAAALALMLAVAPAAADEAASPFGPLAPGQLPAVSGLNGKMELGGGALDGEGFGYGLGSVSVPLGPRFGFQVDALYGASPGGRSVNSAYHLFWRDPAIGLIGPYGELGRFSGPVPAGIAYNRTFGRAGIAGELYLGRVSIEANAGWETGGEINNALADWGATGQLNRFYDNLTLAYYFTDDWRVGVGHRYTRGLNMAALETEYLLHPPGLPPMSVFAEGRVGEADYRSIRAGLRVYIGPPDKSLIRRQREDDPKVVLEPLFARNAAHATVKPAALTAIPPSTVNPAVNQAMGMPAGTSCYPWGNGLLMCSGTGQPNLSAWYTSTKMGSGSIYTDQSANPPQDYMLYTWVMGQRVWYWVPCCG